MSSAAARASSGAQASTSAPSQDLKARFPCREAQIDLLTASVVLNDSPALPVFVVGPAATGKTAVVRALLRAYGLRHAYVDCTEVVAPRPLLSSVLHQLRGGKRQREDGYDACVKCDSISEFLLQLPEAARAAARRAAAAAGAGAGARRSASAAAAAVAPPCWVVVDHAELLARTDLLAALVRARDATRANVGLLLISSLSRSTGHFASLAWGGNQAMTTAEFGGYSREELTRIMDARRRRLHGPRDDAPFRQFLTAFLPAFARASNNLLDLRAAVDRLFPLYLAPLKERREGPAPQAAALYHRIKPRVQGMIRDLDFRGAGRPACAGAGAGAAAAPAADAAGAGAEAAGGGGEGAPPDRRASSRGLSFELPYVSKFLLLAAYIASRNKPATDRVVFDPTLKKRGRRDAQAHDRQVEAELEAKLRGPHSFPLERLLQIFFALYGKEGEEEGDGRREARRTMLQGEVLMQVPSLVALRLLSQSAGDVLEGQVYRCSLTEGAAHAIARNLGVELGHYLKLAAHCRMLRELEAALEGVARDALAGEERFGRVLTAAAGAGPGAEAVAGALARLGIQRNEFGAAEGAAEGFEDLLVMQASRLSSLVRQLGSRSRVAQAQAVAALRGITSGDDSCRDAVVGAGAIPPLVQLLSHSTGGVAPLTRQLSNWDVNVAVLANITLDKVVRGAFGTTAGTSVAGGGIEGGGPAQLAVPSTPQQPPKRCAGCGAAEREGGGGPLRKCSDCQLVYLCSDSCKRAYWRTEHRAHCRMLRELAAAPEGAARDALAGEERFGRVLTAAAGAGPGAEAVAGALARLGIENGNT
eukprot:scaffold8.g1473.t1